MDSKKGKDRGYHPLNSAESLDVHKEKEEENIDPSDTSITPLPSLQVFVVCMVQVSESLNINFLFPFVVFMVDDFGMKPVGVYSGLVF